MYVASAYLNSTIRLPSVFFQVSFGSFWWPKRNEHVWILVDALLELNFPFVKHFPSLTL